MIMLRSQSSRFSGLRRCRVNCKKEMIEIKNRRLGRVWALTKRLKILMVRLRSRLKVLISSKSLTEVESIETMVKALKIKHIICIRI